MEIVTITCGGCNKSCKDPKVLVCGFYCELCMNKLLSGLDVDSNEFCCFFCDEFHKLPGKGFKRLNSMAKIQVKKKKTSYNEAHRDESFNELNNTLKDIKSSIDKIEFDLNNPIDSIKEHCLNQRNKIDLKVEELFKEINDLRDDLFKQIDTFETKCIASLYNNEDKLISYMDFLAETKEFYHKWTNFTFNSEISDTTIQNAL